jgi:hypothetical protein
MSHLTILSQNNIDSYINKLNNNAVRYQIKMWSCFNLNTNDMINIYNHFKNKWLLQNYIITNKTNIIKDLSKNYRYDVLEELIKNDLDYIIDLVELKKGFTPLHCAVWTDDKNFNVNIKTIIKTIDILLTKYKIRIFTTCNFDETDKLKDYKNETILGAIYEQNNTMPIEIKNQIYDYLTQYPKYELFIIEFQHYINKLTENLEQKIKNKFLFILMEYKEHSVKLIFSNLFKITLNLKIEISHKIKFDTELNRYFTVKNIDFSNFKQEIINHCICNCDLYVNNELTDNENSDKYYFIVFSIFGIMYKYSKKNIYNKIKTYKTETWYFKAVLYFIVYSELDLYNLCNYEKKFISNLIKNYYVKSTMLNKITFENAFSLKLNIKNVNEKKINEFTI